MNKCVWCGASTRWYDAVCPRCGKKLQVSTPPPIELPDFGASKPVSKKSEEARSSVAPSGGDSRPDLERRRNDFRLLDGDSKTTRGAENDALSNWRETPAKTVEDAAIVSNVGFAPLVVDVLETSLELPPKTSETVPEIAPEPVETAPEIAPKEKANVQAEPNEIASEPSDEASPKEENAAKRPRGFAAQIVADWEAYRNYCYDSVVFSLEKRRRYLVAFAVNLFVCPPCAFWGARYFLRAFAQEKAGEFSAAMRDSERARFFFVLGLTFFAATLCAYVYYVGASEPQMKVPVPNAKFFMY